jgi:hypothetical protein
MTTCNEILKIQSLTEENFQEFLQKNLKKIFVFETEDYEYHHYFPSHLAISGSSTVSRKFVRQA